MNIGFIGFGNMAQAIVNGMVNKANIDPSLIHVCSAHFDSCQKNAENMGFVPMLQVWKLLEMPN